MSVAHVINVAQKFTFVVHHGRDDGVGTVGDEGDLFNLNSTLANLAKYFWLRGFFLKSLLFKKKLATLIAVKKLIRYLD